MLEQSARLARFGYCIIDVVNECYESVSEEYAQIFGYAAEEFMARFRESEQDMTLVHPEDRENIVKAYANGKYVDIEYRILRADGSVRIVHEISEDICNDAGTPIRSLCTLQDVTESRQVDAALRESEIFRKQAMNVAKLGHSIFDVVASQYKSVSEEYAQIFGYTAQDFMARFRTLEEDMTLVYPEDRAKVALEYEQYYKNGKGADIEYRIVRADGSVRIVLELGQDIHDDAGNPILSLIILQDVTESRQGQAALREREERERAVQALIESEARLKNAQRIARLGYSIWDEKLGREVYYSGETANIFGVSTDWYDASFDQFIELVHQDDRGRVMDQMARSHDARHGFDIEYRILRPDGEMRHIHEVAEVELDEDGKLARTISTIQDITERKQAIAEMERSRALFRQAEEMGQLGHWEWDGVAGRLSFCSEEFARIHEMSVAECLAASSTYEADRLRVHPGDREMYDQAMDIARIREAGIDLEYRLLTAKDNVANRP